MQLIHNHFVADTVIWVNFQIEGIHRYPAAENIPGIEFLAHPHRHIFHFNVAINVFHDDRDIEFILFKRWLQSLFSDKVIKIDYKSCEMLADDLASNISRKYPSRNFTITVSEDQENGCTRFYQSIDSEDC